jgi:phosphoglycerate dehydrogenase-like enzyme
MLLFSAPLDFDLSVLQGQDVALAVSSPGHLVTEWICSPVDQRLIDGAALDQYPNLRILATASTGTNHIDLDACTARGIKVLSLLDDRAGLDTISASAEWTFKLILEGLRLKRPYHELQGKWVGIVGLGRIGTHVLNWCQDFRAETMFHDPYVRWAPSPNFMSLPELFAESNIVVICCALTDETRGMITYDLLSRLPPEAVLVNTARGEVINEADLCRFMAARPDVRVCLDVVTGEVDGTANPERLRQLGAYVTDHIAGESYESRTKAAAIILKLVQRELASETLDGAASPVAEAPHV